MFGELLSDLRFRLRALFHRGDMERELDDELRFHIDREAEKLRAEGIASDEAMRRARVAFGGVENAREESRDGRGVRALEIIMQDLRLAVRGLRAQPTYSMVAILSLAVGISMTAGVMSIFEGVHSGALGFANADRVVAVYDRSNPSRVGRYWVLPPASVEALVARSSQFAGIAPYWNSSITVRGDGWAKTLTAEFTTPSFFSVLGLHAELGRLLTAADSMPGAPPAVVISHGLWTVRFGGSADAIGRTLDINHQKFEIVGVLPQRSAYPEDAALWTMQSAGAEAGDSLASLRAIAGIRSPSDLQRVNAEVAAITGADQHTAGDKRWRHVLGVAPLRDMLAAPMFGELLFMEILGIFVALIASVNFATLVLARGMRRRAELGVRAALGASLPRLVSHMLAECLLLASIGGIIGSLAAPLVAHAVNAMAPGLVPPWMQVTWGVRESAVALALALALGALFGIEPALELARPAVSELMRGNSGRSVGEQHVGSRRRRLVAWQVFLAVGPAVFIVVGLGQSIGNFGEAEIGYDTANLYSGATVPLGATASNVNESTTALLDAIRRTPGVIAVSTSQAGYVMGGLVSVDTNAVATATGDPAFHPASVRGVSWNSVSAEYYSTVKLHVVRGRLPTPAEIERGDPVALVTASGAQSLRGRTTVGWRLRLGKAAFTVIGVVADVDESKSSMGEPVPTVFTASTAKESRQLTVFIRARPSTQHVATDVYATLAAVDPSATLTDLEPAAAQVAARNADRQTTLGFLALVFAVALSLAAVGVYGIMAYAAITRRREIAVRVALGAQRAGTAALVMREAAVQSVVGMTFGVIGGLAAATYFMNSLGGGRTPHIPYGALSLIVVALVATIIVSAMVPVRRAWSINVASVLREDG